MTVVHDMEGGRGRWGVPKQASKKGQASKASQQCPSKCTHDDVVFFVRRLRIANGRAEMLLETRKGVCEKIQINRSKLYGCVRDPIKQQRKRQRGSCIHYKLLLASNQDQYTSQPSLNQAGARF